MARNWKGVLAVEGVMTGDGREIAPGALTWDSGALPLAWLQQSQHGDGMGNPGGVDLGNFTGPTRNGDDIAVDGGVIDDQTEHGAEFVRKLEDGTAPLGNRWGLSIDVDDVTIAFVDIAPEDVTEVDNGEDAVLGSARGSLIASFSGPQAVALWKSTPLAARMFRTLTASAGESIPDDAVIMDEFDPGRFVMRLTSGRIRGVTACPVAAFDGAYLELTGTADDSEAPADDGAADDAIVASAFPLAPPAEWFGDHDAPTDDSDPRLVPQYDRQTGAYIGLAVPLTVTKAGRIFGQLAPAGRCHAALSVCTTVPDSASAYSHFQLGAVECADGSEVATGPLVIGCDHAPLSMTMGEARDHYANKGMEFADVTVTANRYGPWVAGALRPDVTDELIRTIRGGGISGDWRGGSGVDGLELVAVQAVPTPGFPVQRIRPLAASATIVEVAEYEPAMSVTEGVVAMTSAPVQRAVIAASKPCGCSSHPLTASATDDTILTLLAELAHDVRVLKVRTAPMHAAAVAAVTASMRGPAA